MAYRDLRRNKRIPYAGVIQVSWVDVTGQPTFVRGRCLDLSDDGLRMELPVSVPVRTLVTLKFDRIHLTGTASARHVRRAGLKFIVGFELSQQLSQQVVHKFEILQPLSAPVAP